jgi:hypothetical protein
VTDRELRALRKRALAAKSAPTQLERELHASLLVLEVLRLSAPPLRVVEEVSR